MELKKIPLEAGEIKDLGPYYEYTIDDLPYDLPEEYKAFFKKYNGGTSSDDFFHFFGLAGPIQHNVIKWNRGEFWKDFYHLDSACFVFFEDIFGRQYFFKRGRRKNAIYMLSPDDGKTYFMADNYENFLEDVVDDSDAIYSEEKALAETFFAIPSNKKKHLNHLSYKKPIILGGNQGDINNLDQCDSLVNLSILGQLIRELENVEPGTVIKDVKIDYINKEIHLIF